MFNRSQMSRCSPASVCLDYGADEAECDPGDFEISEHGMAFNSRWRFSPGAELAVAICGRNRAGRLTRVTNRGIVIDCENVTPSCWRVTLFWSGVAERGVAREALSGSRP